MAERITWTDASGTDHKLDDILDASSNKLLATWGRQGAGMPGWQFVEQQVPNTDGTWIKNVLAPAGDVLVPVLIKCASESAYDTQLRTMRTWLNPRLGDGYLKIASADGTTRQLACRYLSGLEEDDSSGGKRFPGGALVVLHFRATADPLWQDVSNTTVAFGSANTTIVVANGGDDVAWPVWTITGPITSITLANNTTGKTFTATITLANNTQILTIDTRPFYKTVTRENGSNQYSTLNTTASLWSLATGNNSVQMTIAGTGAGTGVSLAYKQRYLGR